MNRSVFLVLLLVLLPSAVFALGFSDETVRYNDVSRFSTAEKAGISVLTELGAVTGYPDGTFKPGNTLNRAEFLKIVMLSHPDGASEDRIADNCFPDVRSSDWFSGYVCMAKKRGDVRGYPDGMFKPANAVNYAEALKILVERYNYALPQPAPTERWAWYTPYVRAASTAGVALATLEPSNELTRGQMARLAAAFRAQHEGKLDEYRAFEQGSASSASSSRSSISSISFASTASSQSSVLSVASISSSSSSIASASALLFPAVSRFLVAGDLSPIVYDALFTSAQGDARIYEAEMTLRREITAIEYFSLVDGQGVEIARLVPQWYNNPDDTKFKAETVTGSYILPGNTPVRLGLRAKIKPIGAGGTSNDYVEIDTLSIRVKNETTGLQQNIVGSDVHRPAHQTSYGRIISLRNDLGTALVVQQGQDRQLGTFRVEGYATTGALVRTQYVTFGLSTTDVAVSNIYMSGASSDTSADCSTDTGGESIRVTCAIPEAMQNTSIVPLIFRVYANLAVSSAKQSGNVQLTSIGTGDIAKNGSITWTDGVGTFRRMEVGSVVEAGPVVMVTK